jgi:hypothetical protein
VTTRLKSLVAVVGALLTALVTLLADKGVSHMLPSSWQAWLAGGGFALLAGLATYFARNTMTLQQVDQSLQKGDFSLPQLHSAIGGVKPGDGVGGPR